MNHREPITIPGDLSGFNGRMLCSQLRLWKEQIRKHPKGSPARIRANNIYHAYAQELQRRLWEAKQLREVK
jgi:hypothetical protein